MNPFTSTPTLGLYSSTATSTIAAHLAAFRYAGIQVGISSWWGQGSSTDQRLPGDPRCDRRHADPLDGLLRARGDLGPVGQPDHV